MLHSSSFETGALLDDLLVIEDPTATETTIASSSDMQSGGIPDSYANFDETTKHRKDIFK